MTTISNPNARPLATFGLATQLRTPPLGSSSPTFGAVPSLPKRVTPAMRAELQSSPTFATPCWSSYDAEVAAGGGKRSASRREGHNRIQARRSHSSDGTVEGETLLARRKKSNGGRSPSYSPSMSGRVFRERAQSHGAPSRPPRPSNSASIPHPLPHTPTAYRVNKERYESSDHSHEGEKEIIFVGADTRPLDLGIQIDNIYSTYQAVRSTPNLAQSPRSEEFDMKSARVSVATVISRSRGTSPGRQTSTTTITALPSSRSESPALSISCDSHTTLNANLRPASPAGKRLAGGSPRPSHTGTMSGPPGITRGSTVYVSTSTAPPVPVINVPARGTSGPLVSLANRTAHLCTVPGYGWRLHLLEKLEIIMGSVLSMSEAEEILSIGNGVEHRSSTKSAHRKSAIGFAPPSPVRANGRAPSTLLDSPKAGFFRSVKRAFGGASPPPSPTFAPKSPPAKAIFGVQLEIVAQYGCVTSMIAGQRHDLPAVCFNAVEEIYRRGQGTLIPGLLNTTGEPTRVAKLVDIFNSAPSYGEHHDLSIESIHNVTALLRKYLHDLPEPLLDGRLWRLYVSLCVDSTLSTKRRVACAQLILRLLPSSSFSLLVYISAFLSQVPLFPENAIPLESVSILFGASTMAARGLSTAANLKKLALSIGGPNEHDSVAVTTKKAQEGLLWLLLNWNAVADGLLEPDFDVDTDEVMDRVVVVRQRTTSNNTSPTLQAVSSIPKRKVSADQAIEKPPPFSPDFSKSLGTRRRSKSDPVLPAPIPDPKPRGPPPTLTEFSHLLPPPPPIISPDVPFSPRFVRNHSSATFGTPQGSSSCSTHSNPITPALASPMSEPTSPLFHQRRLRDESEGTDTSMGSPRLRERGRFEEVPKLGLVIDAERDGSCTSTEGDGGEGEEEDVVSHSPLFHGARFGKTMGSGNGNGFLRATPEDEFGPLGPPRISVLEDLLDSDDSLYNFPSPPTSVSTHTPRSPGSFGNLNLSSTLSSSPSLMTDDRFLESQQLLETSRMEVAALWRRITENELVRASEKNEVENLRREVEGLRTAKVEGGKSSSAAEIGWMEARCREAKKSLEEAKEELRLVREEKELGEKEGREKEASLRAQLDTIRSVLGSRV